MAVMRPLRTLSLLGFTPILHSSACRVTPLFQQRDLQQCHSYLTSAPHEAFIYRIAASFSAKGQRFNPKTDLLAFNGSNSVLRASIAKKRPNSGQDAFFISGIGSSNDVAFGVADGVGGWSDSGIDSAHFSHGLCKYMTEVARGVEQGAEKKIKAGELLQKGYDAVVADKSIPGGGSTACIAIGSNDGALQVANLGDSGFVQLRPNKVYYTSNPQTHAFNTPYQLSIIPPKILARSIAFGSQPLSDLPKDASITNHTVRHGDVLVFGTDGVWDNLSAADILKLVSRYMTGFNACAASENGLTVSEDLDALTTEGGIAKEHENTLQAIMAVGITGEAKMASLNTKVDGPFAREVQKFYPGEDFHGGKVDDICVVVAIVVGHQIKV